MEMELNIVSIKIILFILFPLTNIHSIPEQVLKQTEDLERV